METSPTEQSSKLIVKSPNEETNQEIKQQPEKKKGILKSVMKFMRRMPARSNYIIY